jgi:elongation factor P
VNLSDGKIYLVTKSIFHTWGRGGSFVNLDFKDIKTGAKKSERYRTADTMERK